MRSVTKSDLVSQTALNSIIQNYNNVHYLEDVCICLFLNIMTDIEC